VVIALALVFGICAVVFGVGLPVAQGGDISPFAFLLVLAILAVVVYSIYSSRHPPRDSYAMRG
jgi:hypothetical protein